MHKTPISILTYIYDNVTRIRESWDARDCYQHMYNDDYNNWKQTAWPGWYFEFLMSQTDIPGVSHFKPKIGNTEFDATAGSSIIDYKTKSSNSAGIILNDEHSVLKVLERYKRIGYVILVGNTKMEEDEEVDQFRISLIGKESKYTKDRKESGKKHRKIVAEFTPIKLVYLDVNTNNFSNLSDFKQGVNSNGGMRKPKLMIDNKDIDYFMKGSVIF